jgi:hypothetical protein
MQMDNRLIAFIGERLRGVALAPGAVVIRSPVQEQSLTVLRPRRALNSPIARSLKERGFVVARGTVTGWREQPGQSSVPLEISVPDFERATATTGGAAITVNLDEDAARYFPPRTRVEVAIRIIGEDEDDGE